MKRLLIVSMLVFGSMQMSAQFAALGINGIINVPFIAVGQTTTLTVDVRNFGFDDITAGCALVTISVPGAIVSITGVNGGLTDPIWTIFSSSLPAGLTLRNTNGIIPANGLPYYIVLNITGTNVSPALTINAAANLNAFQGGCVALGDLDPTDNNQTSSIGVTIPLPVKLSSFDGIATGCNTLLKWTTQQEDNFDYFDVEYSPDGLNFIKAGTVRGRNSTLGGSYEFTYVQQTLKGYYRLKLVDKDGKIYYSGTTLVTSKCKEPSVTLYPNPVKAQQDATIVLKNFGNTAYGYLYDAAGKQLQIIKLVNGTNKLPLRSYASGGYVLKIKDEENNAASLRITIAR